MGRDRRCNETTIYSRSPRTWTIFSQVTKTHLNAVDFMIYSYFFSIVHRRAWLALSHQRFGSKFHRFSKWFGIPWTWFSICPYLLFVEVLNKFVSCRLLGICLPCFLLTFALRSKETYWTLFSLGSMFYKITRRFGFFLRCGSAVFLALRCTVRVRCVLGLDCGGIKGGYYHVAWRRFDC